MTLHPSISKACSQITRSTNIVLLIVMVFTRAKTFIHMMIAYGNHEKNNYNIIACHIQLKSIVDY
jgi:hypothetical protein